MNEDQNVLSESDHERGWVERNFPLRNGREVTLKLTAPSWRVAQELSLLLRKDGDVEHVMRACLSADGAALLNRLTPDAAAEVQIICFALAYGEDFIKKNREIGRKLLETQASAGPSSILSAPDSTGAS